MWYSGKQKLFKEVLDKLEVKTDHAYILKASFTGVKKRIS